MIRRQWNSEAVTLPRAETAEPNTLQIIGGFVATESLFFASSDRINNSSSHYRFFT